MISVSDGQESKYRLAIAVRPRLWESRLDGLRPVTILRGRIVARWLHARRARGATQRARREIVQAPRRKIARIARAARLVGLFSRVGTCARCTASRAGGGGRSGIRGGRLTIVRAPGRSIRAAGRRQSLRGAAARSSCESRRSNRRAAPAARPLRRLKPKCRSGRRLRSPCRPGLLLLLRNCVCVGPEPDRAGCLLTGPSREFRHSRTRRRRSAGGGSRRAAAITWGCRARNPSRRSGWRRTSGVAFRTWPGVVLALGTGLLVEVVRRRRTARAESTYSL